MNKIVDRIANLNDLDEFTTYILNPESEDSIIAINDPKDFETEKLFIGVDRNVAKVTFERLHDIVMGNLEYVAETNEPNNIIYIEGLESSKTLTIQEIQFKIF